MSQLVTTVDADIDFSRLRQQRYRKVQAAMKKHGVNALILSRPLNSLYATGTEQIGGLAGYIYCPIVTVVPIEGPPWIFTTDPDGIAPEVPVEQTFGPVYLEYNSGATGLGQWLNDALEPLANGKIGVDSWTGALYESLPKLLPKARFVNGEAVLWDAKRIKTEDERKLVRIAEVVAETALFAALEKLRPGVSELELANAYNHRVSELGYKSGGQAYPIFCSQPRSRADMPYAAEVLPYRKLTRNRIISDGDLISIDCGSEVHGYAGDVGRTWYADYSSRPSAKQKDLYKAWRGVIDRMLELCRPGTTAADLHRAAGNENITTYVGHSIGVGSPDGFVVGGRSISWEEEEEWVLEPGMCLLVEPIIFREGIGNFRAEEHVFITEDGHEQISLFPHGPLAE